MKYREFELTRMEIGTEPFLCSNFLRQDKDGNYVDEPFRSIILYRTTPEGRVKGLFLKIEEEEFEGWSK